MATQKRKTKKTTAGRKTTRRKRPANGRWRKLWPKLVGAFLVMVSCYYLLRTLFTSSAGREVKPPKGFTVYGIDVSHHQGAIDWEVLRNRGIVGDQPLSFVFIKATEGGDMVDSRFKANFAEAGKYGMVRGAYHFYRPATSAKQQAEHFIRNVELQPGDLPPVLDVEVRPANIGVEAFRQGILEWLARVEQHYGVRPILYTYHSFRQQYLNDPVFELYPYWIAHYHVDSVRYKGPWAFWQYSDRGELPGIKGKVDLNVFRGSYDELLQMGR